MIALRAISRVLSSSSPPPPSTSKILSSHLYRSCLSRSFAARALRQTPAPAPADSDADLPSADFDSSAFSLPTQAPTAPKRPIWDEAHRARADEVLFGKAAAQSRSHPEVVEDDDEDEERERSTRLARALLEAALGQPDEDEEEDMVVKEEDQRSLSVGIIGAPNAGKSCLTNFMCFFDTPGLMIGQHGYPYRTDVKVRVESAWSSIGLYDLLIMMFDVHRHLTMPDTRVIKLIKQMGEKVHSKQKRVLCMNKVDLVEDKKDLLKVAKEFADLPGYDKYFMISGLKGSGIKDLVQYLMDQAVKRPWDEDPTTMSEEIMKTISLEVVREKMLDHIHQEIPYVIEHRLMDWKELRDGSLRVEQHFITPKPSQRQILVGKNGSKIGRIGIEANEELRSIFKRNVHLILQVRVARKRNA
ncbi:GTP-binding protein ERG isoform X2 [Musa acuminata AAA Group]|uniref:GTP-binding protein ERG isoform X2 n=1 Tax=Musa acuminata AAA Group TaxID=214697 RepID=UPI0031D5FDBB